MESFDLLVVGGGINGTAIARAAAISGLSVLLVEKDDLAFHTSSASSKLIHGGLRYLEYYEFRLVREALKERKILLATAPHIVRPLRFVLPHAPGMRPWWMVRAGLYLYDLLALRGGLPRSHGVGPKDERFRSSLKARNVPMALYCDAWVDDARLVVLNAIDAAERGAEIATRTEFLGAEARNGCWTARLSGGRTVSASAIVNAAGAWVGEILGTRLHAPGRSGVRLVRGSHIVVPRLYEGDHAYVLQQPDGRVVFALPYGPYSLVGTTDVPVEAPAKPLIDQTEIRYLCAAVNGYFRAETKPGDVVWTYSGLRALHDDGAAKAQAVTRDYHLDLQDRNGARLLSVFGGKITTARALAEEALDRLGAKGRRITDTAPLPGGDLNPAFLDWLAELCRWMPPAMAARLSQAYGTRLKDLIGVAGSLSALGRHFGADLYEAEICWLRDREFARTADDILWRRTKLGLWVSEEERMELAAYLDDQSSGVPA